MIKKKLLVIAAIAVLGAVVPVDSANASCVAEIYDVTPDSQSPSSLVAWFRGRCSGPHGEVGYSYNGKEVLGMTGYNPVMGYFFANGGFGIPIEKGLESYTIRIWFKDADGFVFSDPWTYWNPDFVSTPVEPTLSTSTTISPTTTIPASTTTTVSPTTTTTLAVAPVLSVEVTVTGSVEIKSSVPVMKVLKKVCVKNQKVQGKSHPKCKVAKK
jgi:hypothetical protein